MNKIVVRGLATSAAALLAATAYSSTAAAQATATPVTYQVNLAQANRSGASGTATLTLTGNSLRVSVRASGLSANQAHATHIHAGGQANCPTSAADANRDNYVDAKEAETVTGPVRISLTTSGDTAAGSALAVDRAPRADARGNLTYDRTFNLPSGVTAADMQRASIDIHGIASLFDDRNRYDGSRRSELDNRVPFETTVPAACGRLTSAPAGGAATGAGSIAGIESPALLIGGSAAIALAAAMVLYSRRPLAGRQ